MFLNYCKTNQNQLFFKTKSCILDAKFDVDSDFFLSNMVWIHDLTELWAVKVKKHHKSTTG